MYRRFRKSVTSSHVTYQGKHRYEHWYVDNQFYFITSSVRDHYDAFASEKAKEIFWDRFDFYTKKYQFTPSVASLLDNHYHFIGHLLIGENLGEMMRRLHGSVAKLVNDILPVRHLPFWRERGRRDYFDGCLRTEHQLRKAHQYTKLQAQKASIVSDWRLYPHTKVMIEVEECIRMARNLDALMPNVPYKRYDGNK